MVVGNGCFNDRADPLEGSCPFSLIAGTKERRFRCWHASPTDFDQKVLLSPVFTDETVDIPFWRSVGRSELAAGRTFAESLVN